MPTKDKDQDAKPAEVASVPADIRTVEAWAAAKKHNPQPFGQARMLHGWVEGVELTEKEYDAAVAAVANVRHG